MTGSNPLIDVAVELERNALEDDYFSSRRLYPQCRLLQWNHLSGDGFPGGDVPCVICTWQSTGLAGPVGRADDRPGPAYRPSTTDLPRRRRAHVRRNRRSRLKRMPGASARCAPGLGPTITRYRRGRARTSLPAPEAADASVDRDLPAAGSWLLPAPVSTYRNRSGEPFSHPAGRSGTVPRMSPGPRSSRSSFSQLEAVGRLRKGLEPIGLGAIFCPA